MALGTGPQNAAKPTTSFLTGAVYNATPPTVGSGQQCALQCDVNGKLIVSATFSGTISGNAAAGPTGSLVPASADYIGFNVGGNLVGVSAGNPLPITGSISASNPSVGPTGSPVPADATAIGVQDGSGNLQIASSANPVRIDPTGTTIQPVNGTVVVKGNVASGSAVSGANPPVLVAGQDGTNVRTLLSSSTGQLHVIVDSGGGGGTQYTDGTAESAGAFTITVAGSYNGTDVVGLRSDASNNLLVNLNTAVPAGTNLIGLIEISDGTNAMGAMANFGTSPTGVKALNANASLFIGTTVASAAASGVQLVGIEGHAGGVFDAATGAAVPANAIMVGGTDGTDLRAFSVNSSGQQVVVGAGTAGSGSGGVLSIQGVASGVTVPITGTITAVTTITNPVTVVGDAASGSAVAGNPVLVAGQDGTDARTLLTSNTGQLHVVADTGSTTAVTQATAANLNATVVPGGSAIFEVSPTTAANTSANPFFNEITDGTNVMGAMTNFGTTPTAVKALSANVSLFQGTTAVGSGAPLQVSLANTGSNSTAISTKDAADMSGTTPGTAPSNTLITGGIYNSSAPSPTTGQTLPLQLDSSGNLNVNIKAGAGSGGTAITDEGTFTEGTTSFTPIGGYYKTSPTALTTGEGGAVSLTSARAMFIDLHSVGGTAVTLGQAVAASSIPVVLPSGTNVPVTGTLTAVTSITNPVTVVGDAASGSAVAGNPVLTGGSDGTDARTFLTSSTGQLHVVADTGSTTAVTQATAANLNATVVPGGSAIFEVSPTTAANTVSNTFFTQIGDGTHAATLNSTTYTSKYGLDVILLGTKGTAFTTAGFVDIKGADGNVFVRQATAANLNATVVPGGSAVFEVSPTTAANT